MALMEWRLAAVGYPLTPSRGWIFQHHQMVLQVIYVTTWLRTLVTCLQLCHQMYMCLRLCHQMRPQTQSSSLLTFDKEVRDKKSERSARFQFHCIGVSW